MSSSSRLPTASQETTTFRPINWGADDTQTSTVRPQPDSQERPRLSSPFQSPMPCRPASDTTSSPGCTSSPGTISAPGSAGQDFRPIFLQFREALGPALQDAETALWELFENRCSTMPCIPKVVEQALTTSVDVMPMFAQVNLSAMGTDLKLDVDVDYVPQHDNDGLEYYWIGINPNYHGPSSDGTAETREHLAKFGVLAGFTRNSEGHEGGWKRTSIELETHHPPEVSATFAKHLHAYDIELDDPEHQSDGALQGLFPAYDSIMEEFQSRRRKHGLEVSRRGNDDTIMQVLGLAEPIQSNPTVGNTDQISQPGNFRKYSIAQLSDAMSRLTEDQRQSPGFWSAFNNALESCVLSEGMSEPDDNVGAVEPNQSTNPGPQRGSSGMSELSSGGSGWMNTVFDNKGATFPGVPLAQSTAESHVAGSSYEVQAPQLAPDSQDAITKAQSELQNKRKHRQSYSLEEHQTKRTRNGSSASIDAWDP